MRALSSSSCPARAAVRGARFQQPMCQEDPRNRPRVRTSNARNRSRVCPPAHHALRFVTGRAGGGLKHRPLGADARHQQRRARKPRYRRRHARARDLGRAVGGDGPFGPISPRRRATMRSASPNPGASARHQWDDRHPASPPSPSDRGCRGHRKRRATSRAPFDAEFPRGRRQTLLDPMTRSQKLGTSGGDATGSSRQ